MIVLVAGSRDYNDYDELRDVLNYIHNKVKIEHVVEGDARGADKLAGKGAADNHILLTELPADWNNLGIKAGYLRNVQMHQFINKFEDRLCVCFWDGQSKGTAHNFELCDRYDTPLIVYNYKIHQVVKQKGIRI